MSSVIAAAPDAATAIPLSRALARLVLDRHRRGLPPDVQARAELHALDSLGIAIAARPVLPICQQVIEAMSFGTTGGTSAIIGGAERLPPAAAAFVNAALAHALDYDDIHDVARLHPTTVTLHAALAVAEPAGADMARVLSAMALGNEVMCRLGEACAPSGGGPGSDWFLTQLFGYLGGCVAACVTLDMTEEQLVSALGLAYMQLAGGKEAGFGVGSTARSIYPAFAAMGGVQAALLARAGVSGPETALDGAAGMFRIYLGGDAGPATRAAVIDRPGWCWLATEVKPWPSCRLSHPYVAAALALRERLGGPPARGRIAVAVNASAAKLCHPIAGRRVPDTLQDAKYSIPFMTAFTLAHGRVDLDTLGPQVTGDAAALALAQRIDIFETMPDKPGHPPAEITAEGPDGPVTVRRTAAPVLDAAGVRAKFEECLRHAGRDDASGATWDALLRALRHGSAADLVAAVPR
ncbi:MmgE/PrpD family protein [Roseomonas sp. HJA6]|uniref:MmgE/PrpD family protein n=1 Tax=Roseomonas alba TaxID=2846776 RepID=A0ABS7A3J3_9PROT|nr:MmgE/PrpD family protein [Neoroseomonas alba]MBW6396858.1 MmgE/PrpD family protein [Neoroseomonas alba]